MARNDSRRDQLADAGITVLAREGSRGLTHRAVDRESGLPSGTVSNYFRSRAELVEGLLHRIVERLTPDAATLEELGSLPAGRESFTRHLRDILRRMLADRDVTLAWFEMRLEAARRPEVSTLMHEVLLAGFRGDVAYNEAAGLPGGAREIALFHYAVDGLILDRVTVSIDPDSDLDQVVEDLVAGLLPTTPAG